MKLGMQIGLGPGHIVLGGDTTYTSPLLKGHTPPQFSAHICCGQTAAWINMSLGMEVGLGPGDFVLDGEPAPPPQIKGGGGRALPNFSAHVYSGKTAGWMKLVLGTEVGLSPGDFVLEFSAHFYCGQTAACIKMPLGIELGLGPGDFVLDKLTR